MAHFINKVQHYTRCSTAYCLRKHKQSGPLKSCYKFPFDLCDASHLRQDEKGLLELITESVDQLVNKYHPWSLQLWRVNIDFTPVLSKEAFLNYIAKYASKTEVRANKIYVYTNIKQKGRYKYGAKL